MSQTSNISSARRDPHSYRETTSPVLQSTLPAWCTALLRLPPWWLWMKRTQNKLTIKPGEFDCYLFTFLLHAAVFTWRSTIPSDCGCNSVVTVLLTPNRSRISCISLDSNVRPWSLCSSIGKPKLQKLVNHGVCHCRCLLVRDDIRLATSWSSLWLSRDISVPCHSLGNSQRFQLQFFRRVLWCCIGAPESEFWFWTWVGDTIVTLLTPPLNVIP